MYHRLMYHDVVIWLQHPTILFLTMALGKGQRHTMGMACLSCLESGSVTAQCVGPHRVQCQRLRVCCCVLLLNAQGSTVVEQVLEVEGRKWAMTCVSMGNPHAITYSVDGQPIKVRLDKQTRNALKRRCLQMLWAKVASIFVTFLMAC